MNVFSMRMIRGVAYAAIWLSVTAAPGETATVKAANTFLATLNEKQRQSVLYSFDDVQQRARWSNFPTGIVPRGGISLREMTPRSVPPPWLWYPPRSAARGLRRFNKSWRATR